MDIIFKSEALIYISKYAFGNLTMLVSVLYMSENYGMFFFV